jgi:DNA-binding NarL/FixJ family response regulator
MLLGESADAEGLVVAGDIAVYRDLIAERLGARAVTTDGVGDARLVVLCRPEADPSNVAALTGDPDRRVIVVGATDDDAVSYYEMGAFYVIPPHASLEETCVAVEKARWGERAEPSPRHMRLVFDRLRERSTADDAVRTPELTPRELEVAKLMLKDLRDKEIARRLFISHSTAKKHVIAIRRKLGVSNRREATELLRRRGRS